MNIATVERVGHWLVPVMFITIGTVILNRDQLEALVYALLKAAPWLELGNHADLCARSDDSFDAVIAALTSRAAALSRTTVPADMVQRDQARREGWIALPTGPLSSLVTNE